MEGDGEELGGGGAQVSSFILIQAVKPSQRMGDSVWGAVV